MPVFFEETERLFTLSTASTTLSFAAFDAGYLMSQYYGKKIHPVNLYSLREPLPVGFTSSYCNALNKSSLDELPLEYPVYGGGDYHEAALGVEFEDGNRLLDPVYQSHRILEGTPEPSGLPGLSGGDQTLEITLEDRYTGLLVHLYYGLFEKNDIITRHARIENTTKKPVRITRALSASLDLPTADYDMITSYGYHLEENQICRQHLHHGVQSIGSRRGASSHNHNPFLILTTPATTERAGEAYGMALIYSGNFIARAEVDGYSRTRMQIGIHPDDFRWTLEPGASFVTPQAVLSYTSNGLNALSRNFHQIIKHNLGHSPWRERPRPIVINNWEGTYFDFDEKKILDIIHNCKGLGIDTFVLDDGWFGNDAVCRDNDATSLGDWFVAKQKLPHGLTPLIEACEQQGMSFGLWFEPEMISEDSALYRKHPDWPIHKEGRPFCRGRNQLVLDITREEVYQYLEQRLFAILAENKISYIKWDMNRHMTDAYSSALPPERQPELFHRYILQLYRLLKSLNEHFPEVLIEGCSGGGGRFDMGMLYYCPQFWASDDSEAVERLRIQYGTSLIYPPQAMTAHVSACPNHQTGRSTPMETRCAVAMSATYGYELDPRKLPENERRAIAQQTARYHMLQPLVMKGDFYRLADPFTMPYCAWMFVSADRTKAVFTAVWQLHRAQARAFVKLDGLDPETFYEVKKPDGTLLGHFMGDVLMHAGIRLAPIADFEAIVYDIVRIKGLCEKQLNAT